jgi:hypothetical protein
MEEESAITELAKELGVTVKEPGYSLNRQLLAHQINELIHSGFDKLIAILYRLDVSETKLKELLKDFPQEDAGLLIADLMIERQIQKIKSRGQFKRQDKNIDEAEKW